MAGLSTDGGSDEFRRQEKTVTAPSWSLDGRAQTGKGRRWYLRDAKKRKPLSLWLGKGADSQRPFSQLRRLFCGSELHYVGLQREYLYF